MAFPNAERVIYEKNPLNEVICRVRFPPILRIDAESPSAFQDEIRADFPFFHLKSSINLPANLPPQLAQVVSRDFGLIGGKSFVFESADRVWQVTVARETLALSCRHYERWERFRERFARLFETFARVYAPGFYTHVCLRYRDVLCRSTLELGNKPWKDLIQPWISGPLSRAETMNDAHSIQTRCVIALPDGIGQVDATYGLGVQESNKEPVFVIEAHLYNEQQTGQSNVTKCLDSLNLQARLFFRWCITEDLHRAMRPAALA